MNIQSLNIPYPDFKLQEIIDPEQFDLNNKSVVDKITEILAKLNQIIGSVTDGSSGADSIASTAIVGLDGTTVQSQLKSLKALLDGILTQFTTHKTSGDHDIRYYQKQEVNAMQALQTSNIVDGGSFLDTYGSQSGVLDGGAF